MSLSYQPYNVTLPSFSPVLNYTPWQDGNALQGWNSSFTESTVRALTDENNPFNIGSGVAYRTTEHDGAAVSVNFEGTAVYMCLTTGASASYTFIVDDSIIHTTGSTSDPACAIYGGEPQTLVYADNLSYGTHNATLQANSRFVDANGDLNFYGATVTISAGSPAPKIVRVADNSDPSWDYSAGWSSYTDDPNMWGGSYQVNCNYRSDSTASYTFQGASAIVLRGLSMYKYAGYTITLDNNPAATFNATDHYWRHSPVILFFAGGLNTTDSHTLTITNYDASQADPPTNHPGGSVCASIDTLSLVMEDTASMDAILASIQPPAPTACSAPQYVQPPFPASTVAAVVLVIFLGIVVFLNGLQLYRWRKNGVLSPASPFRLFMDTTKADSLTEALPNPFAFVRSSMYVTETEPQPVPWTAPIPAATRAGNWRPPNSTRANTTTTVSSFIQPSPTSETHSPPIFITDSPEPIHDASASPATRAASYPEPSLPAIPPRLSLGLQTIVPLSLQTISSRESSLPAGTALTASGSSYLQRSGTRLRSPAGESGTAGIEMQSLPHQNQSDHPPSRRSTRKSVKHRSAKSAKSVASGPRGSMAPSLGELVENLSRMMTGHLDEGEADLESEGVKSPRGSLEGTRAIDES